MRANSSLRPEELIAHAGWMRALANSLLGDPNSAEDVFQEAFATAASPLPRPVQKPRAWLAGIVRGLVRDRRRSDAARSYREQRHALERPRTVPSAADVVAQAQTQSLLSKAVLALDEPLQRVVVLRWFEGQSAEQIAQLDNVPASTVRSRLQRGIHALRADLEGRIGVDWRSALMPLIPVPPKLPSPSIPFVLLMSSSMKASLCLFGVGILGFSFWPDAPIESHPTSTAIVSEDRPALQRDVEAPKESESSARVIIPAAPEEKFVDDSTPLASSDPVPLPTQLLVGQLEVYVTLAGHPVSAGWVHLAEFVPSAAPPDPWSDTKATQHRIGPDGIARLENVGTKGHCSIVVDIEHGMYRQAVKLRDDQGQRVHVDLSANVVHGVVYGENGQPASEVAISGWVKSMAYRVWGRTDAQGRYELNGLSDGMVQLLVEREFELRSNLEISGGVKVEHNIGASTQWVRVQGTLLDTSGNPIAGHAASKAPLKLRSLDGTWSRSFGLNADGSIDLQAPPGIYMVNVKPPCSKSHRRIVLAEELELGAGGPRVSWILPGATVRGQVFTSTGLPAEPPAVGSQSFGLIMDAGSFLACSLSMNADGTYILQGVQPGSYRISAYPRELDQPTYVEVTETQDQIIKDLTIQ